MQSDSEPKSEPKPEQGSATRIIHNRRHKDSLGSPYSPVYNTTTYRFPDTASLQDVIEGRTPGNLYTRWGSNPTIRELEQGLAGRRCVGICLWHGCYFGILVYPWS